MTLQCNNSLSEKTENITGTIQMNDLHRETLEPIAPKPVTSPFSLGIKIFYFILQNVPEILVVLCFPYLYLVTGRLGARLKFDRRCQCEVSVIAMGSGVEVEVVVGPAGRLAAGVTMWILSSCSCCTRRARASLLPATMMKGEAAWSCSSGPPATRQIQQATSRILTQQINSQHSGGGLVSP